MMKTRIPNRLAPVFFALCLWTGESVAQVEVLWLGHATVRITSVNGKVIVIDPFLKQNPKTPAQYKDLTSFGKVDLILVTHAHQDHMRDLPELARLTGAKVVGSFEFINSFVAIGAIDASRSVAMNKGGTVEPLGRGISVHMVPAEHSASGDLVYLGLRQPGSNEPRYVEQGAPVGYVIRLENGFSIYHSGDTDVFGDMALIHQFFKPNLALVCIGGHFTMDPERAAYAVRELLKPEKVVPIHYGTYPVINRTPAEFKAALGDSPIELMDVEPGQSLKF